MSAVQPRSSASTARSQTDRQIALLLAALALGLYLRNMAPELLPGDPGEFQFAAWTLGLAHPTGYPLYLLVGSGWQHLLAMFGVSPATALNALSALFGAVAVGLTYVLIHSWLDGPAVLRRASAVFGAAFLAVNPTFWSQSLIAEVYALHAVFVIAILLAAQQVQMRAMQRKDHPPTRALALLFVLIGLSLTHHATTLLLLPGLALFLWLVGGRRWLTVRMIGLAAVSVGLPLLLYLYIPLRSGPEASPWYHQRLGDQTLVLYDGTWRAFVDFVTGRAISVGFHALGEAVAQVGQAFVLWRLHFLWPGLILMGMGLAVLIWRRNWPVLALTGVSALLLQVFNLFYAIGDILVYYIPLYVMGVVWAAFAVHWLLTAGWHFGAQQSPVATESAGEQPAPPLAVGLVIIMLALVFLLPFQLLTRYLGPLDQSNSHTARSTWEAILGAQPPDDAVLVSNDRNEVVPLFYLQAVEGRAGGMTGLFPLIAPDARFADVGATVETALAAGNQPVYLTKEMPGLETRFELQEGPAPLVQVTGPAANVAPERPVNAAYGPLELLGYDWRTQAEGVFVRLHWRVSERPAADYTTTVQLLDSGGNKIAQHDAPSGGVYYPTSLWKPGEVLIDSHWLDVRADAEGDTLLVGMYNAADEQLLAPPLRLTIGAADAEAGS